MRKGGWLRFDFSWQTRILIVLHSTQMLFFMLTITSQMLPLCLNLEPNTEVLIDFLHYQLLLTIEFSLASCHMLYICDIAKPDDFNSTFGS